MHDRLYLPSKTGQGELCVHIWEPERPKAVLQIAHGMAEHMGRYEGLASYLSRNGVAVIGHDMAGHGESTPGGIKGYFGPGDGWSRILGDLHMAAGEAERRWPGLPRVLMGHSMGSFLVECYMARWGGAAAYIISGTAGKNPALPIAKAIARAQMALGRDKKPSKLLNGLSFGAYNKHFRPNRTAFDWISRDEAEVDGYIADENCGFVFTAAAFYQLFRGLAEIASDDWLKRTDHKPIFMVSGSMDPVGGMGKGVEELYARLVQAGREVELKLYPEGRHELLHGPDEESVRQDILEFVIGQVEL